MCSRVLGLELSEEEEAAHADLVREARGEVFEPLKGGGVGETAVDARWVLTRKMVDGVKTVKARQVASGLQDPGLKDGIADTSRCVSLCSPHLQVMSLSAPKKWKLRNLDIGNTILQADGFTGDVFLRAPPEWEPSDACRRWESGAPAYGLTEAPVAFRRSLQERLLNSELSLAKVGLQYEVSPFDPCLYFVFRGGGGAVGAFTTHSDHNAGRGEPGVIAKPGAVFWGRASGSRRLRMWGWSCPRQTITRRFLPRPTSLPSWRPWKHPRPCGWPGSGCHAQRTLFDVNLDWGSLVGPPLRRVQIHGLAWGLKRIRPMGRDNHRIIVLIKTA